MGPKDILPKAMNEYMDIMDWLMVTQQLGTMDSDGNQ
jgi:hypothetical protein